MEDDMDKATEALGEKAEEAYIRLGRDENWSLWETVGKALDAARRDIFRRHGINRPYGRAYTKEMGDFLARHHLDTIDKAIRNTLQKCIDHIDLIKKRREEIGLTRRLELNHPRSVWKDFEKNVLGKEEKDPDLVKPQSPVAKRDEIIAELQGENDKLKKRIERSDDANALFDWNTDEPAIIARILLEKYPFKAPKVATLILNGTKPDVHRPKRKSKAQSTEVAAT